MTDCQALPATVTAPSGAGQAVSLQVRREVVIKQNENMKSKMKGQGSTELPRFIVGALAAAGASAASGATVQISFANNVVSSATGTTNFVTDLTGDLVDDVGGFNLPEQKLVAVTYLSSTIAVAGLSQELRFGVVFPGTDGYYSLAGITRRKLVAFTFSDTRINDEAMGGWLDVTATSSSSGKMIQIHRLIFDDASTTAPTGVAYTDAAYPEFVAAVPEPGSNLALLALGAGGLTLRRRLKRAA